MVYASDTDLFRTRKVILKRLHFTDFLSKFRILSYTWLAFAWCLGLSSGHWLVSSAEPFCPSLMYAFVSQRISIFGLLFVSILPFLLSALAIRYRVFGFLVPIAFYEAFLLGYSHNAFLQAFGDCGWLVCFFFLFSQSVSAVLLLWYWMRNIDHSTVWRPLEFYNFLFAIFALCITWYCFIYPCGLDLMMQR